MNIEDLSPDESEFFSPDEITEVEETEAVTNEAEAGDDALDDDEETDLEIDGGEENGDDTELKGEKAETAEIEYEEREHNGLKYKIPKADVPELMFQKNYTQKTQEHAENVRNWSEVAAQKQAEIEQQFETVQQFTQEYAELQNIDNRLQEFEKLTQADWQNWEQQDYMESQQGFREYTILKDKRAQLVQTVGEKHQKVLHEKEQRSRDEQQAHQANTAKLHEEAISTVKRVVPNWDKNLAKEVSAFATENGFTQEQLRQASTHAPSMLMFHKAWVGHQLETKTKAAAKQAKADMTPQGKPLTPVAKGRSASAPAGLSDDLPMDEWQVRRIAQVRKRRA